MKITGFSILLIVFSTACGEAKFGGKAPKPPAASASENSVNASATQDSRVDEASTQKASAEDGAKIGPSENSETSTPSGEPQEYKEDFTISATTSLVDMVFVVNNYLTMIDEAAQVSANLNTFLTSMASVANMKVAMISKKALGLLTTGVTLPSAANYTQISDMDVSSNDSLAMIAAASCDANSSGRVASGKYKICNVETNLLRNYDAIKGKLTGFFRPTAKAVVISVSDNQATDVDDKNFLTMMAPFAKPTLYSFQGFTSSAGCIIFGRGAAYEALAGATGGRTFDVCAKDWSPNFSAISSAIGLQLKKQFVLKSATAGKIVEVQVNAKAIDATLYQLIGNTIIINDSIAKDAKTVSVRYLAK